MAAKTPFDWNPVFSASFKAGDLAGIMALYADEIVAVPEPGARLHGKAEVEAAFGAFLAMSPCTLTWEPVLVEGPGHALLMGDWAFDGVSPDGPVHIEAHATVVLEERADGWYAVIDDFFSQA